MEASIQHRGPVPVPSRGSGRAIPDWVPAGLFLLIPLGFLTVMAFIPLLREGWLSFTNARLTNPNGGAFVGFDNYRTLFAGPQLPHVLRNTLVYTLGTSAL